jgi:hypothetical protein
VASTELTEHEDVALGDRVVLIADAEDGMYSEGEEGHIIQITEYSGTMNDRVAFYFLPDWVDPASDDAETARFEVPRHSFEQM